MLDKEPNIYEQVWNFFLKIFIPSFIAISIKVATQIKREKMTFTRVLLSFISGIGCAYFIFPFTEKHIEVSFIPLIVGVVSISGEKIAEYLIYKFNLDFFLSSILDAFRVCIIKIISKQQ